MPTHPLTRPERDRLLERHAEALRKVDEALETEDEAAEDRFSLEAEQIEKAYFEGLPRIVMSCCPFDGKPLVRSIDPYGLNGLWWRSDASPTELPACPHFCVLRGGIHFNQNKPVGGSFEAHTGPEIPYVIPRLLEKPGMIVVLSQVTMATGPIAHLMAYFAERRPSAEELAAHWPRKIYHYKTAFAEVGWRVDNEQWDFNLAPWLAKEKVRWCPPGSDNTTLNAIPSAKCPYLDLQGVRQPIVVEGEQMWTMGVPDGTPISPYD